MKLTSSGGSFSSISLPKLIRLAIFWANYNTYNA
jgi:hypothetical protein